MSDIYIVFVTFNIMFCQFEFDFVVFVIINVKQIISQKKPKTAQHLRIQPD